VNEAIFVSRAIQTQTPLGRRLRRELRTYQVQAGQSASLNGFVARLRRLIADDPTFAFAITDEKSPWQRSITVRARAIKASLNINHGKGHLHDRRRPYYAQRAKYSTRL
jgi:hypothetical protein